MILKAIIELRYRRAMLWYAHLSDESQRLLAKTEFGGDVQDKDLYSGLVRLHVLHHACEGEVFGLDMIEELARHGYKMSPGTMYPILHGLEKRGYVKSTDFRSGNVRRRLYRATPAGRKALKAAKQKVRELFGELIKGN